MTTIFTNISTYSRFNLSESESDIHIFVKEYKNRVISQLAREEEGGPSPFVSYAETKLTVPDETWLQDNYDRFLKNTANEHLVKENYLSELGYICSMIYTPGGDYIICGHSTGFIQQSLYHYYGIDNNTQKIWYPMFSDCKHVNHTEFRWVKENNKRFIEGTENKFLFTRVFLSESGYITSMVYSPNGYHVICGHSSGLIQMRHGKSGIVLATLRNIQFPPKPVYALEYGRNEERICYAACTDGIVYRIEIPNLDTAQSENEMCIRADPALGCLHTQFYGSPGIASYSNPFVTQRSPALALGINSDNTKMVVGYGDTSVKVYDMETQEVDLTFKVHKLRLQFIPKKLQRIHWAPVCAVRCHNDKPTVFASAGWDKTMRIWDTRCKVGCMMTFEGVDCAHDSIDLNREQAITGSWQPTEGLSLWDITARKRLSVIRIQNRRPDVDGEYIYACRYWRSSEYNRKGKYAIIGGSGTKCLEVVHLHNRYISCSYPAPGTILAVASHQERIAFGGTAPVFNIVSFHDPKHEKFPENDETEYYDYGKAAVTLFDRAEVSGRSSDPEIVSDVSKGTSRKSRVFMMGEGRKSMIESRKNMPGGADAKSVEIKKSTIGVDGKKSTIGVAPI